MRALALLLFGLLGGDDPTDYSRSLGAKALDQPTLDAEGYCNSNEWALLGPV